VILIILVVKDNLVVDILRVGNQRRHLRLRGSLNRGNDRNAAT
jgi:hypothetical protein